MTPAAAAASASRSRLISIPPDELLHLSSPVRAALEAAPYAPPPGSHFSVKSYLLSFPLSTSALDFLLFCSAASAATPESPSLHWITRPVVSSAWEAVVALATAARYQTLEAMLLDVMPELVPRVKAVIRETCLDTKSDEMSAASAKTPVGMAIVAAHQFRWMLSQVSCPNLGDMCWLVIPCALTALDHWSPEVKEQGLTSFVHIAKNVNIADLSWYEEAILDACHRNIPASDELWPQVIETSLLLLTYTQRSNPRSLWFDRMLSEMIGHLERQPFNKERRISWLKLVDSTFSVMGLFLLAHFHRLFSLFFQWMHADDDETVILVLERIHLILKLTWIRRSSLNERLVDELVSLYKESATRISREVIRSSIFQILPILRRCQGSQFENAWSKHNADPDLAMLVSYVGSLAIES